MNTDLHQAFRWHMRAGRMAKNYAQGYRAPLYRGTLERIRESRAKRAELAAGDADGLCFWPGEARLQEAFNEGAGESVL